MEERLGKGQDGLLHPIQGPIGVNDPFRPDLHPMEERRENKESRGDRL